MMQTVDETSTNKAIGHINNIIYKGLEFVTFITFSVIVVRSTTSEAIHTNLVILSAAKDLLNTDDYVKEILHLATLVQDDHVISLPVKGGLGRVYDTPVPTTT